MNDTDLIVLKVDNARQLLQAASNAGEAKQVADLALAAEIYARRQKLSQEAIDYATAVKVDALTLLGKFLKANPPKKGGPGGPGRGRKGKKANSQTEFAFGLPPEIPPKVSSDAQKLADLEEEAPEAHEEVRAGKVKVSKAAQTVRKKKKRQKLHEQARRAEANGVPPPDIHCIDCRLGLAAIPQGSVNLIFADPPYNIGIDYGDGTQADLLEHTAYLAFCAEWLTACFRALADDGSFWLLVPDEWADWLSLALIKAQFHRRAWVKWYETFGVNCANNFNRCSRHLFYCVKDPKRFTFHPEAVNRPSDRQTKYKDARADPDGKIWDDVWEIPRLVGTAKERIPDFPTQLPLELLRPIIGCSSNPGDLVVDPFCGSATTGAAALEVGRRFIGFEKQPRFVELATLRLQGVRHG